MDVLIVEDERITRQLLQRQLEKWGHAVTACESACEAWEVLKAREISLVISDWQMPGMSGPELVTQIRKQLTSRYVYTILLTSKSESSDMIAGMEAGADDFLTKPFNAGELRVRLRAGERLVGLQQALAEKNRQMQADLEAGARFARLLLPKPLHEPWRTAFEYVPSSVVSGDALGYHWIDDDHFAVYVLDVTGHGLDAALLATTLHNVIRSGSLTHADPRDPSQMLSGLNATFPMESFGDKCFTIWYGVMHRGTRVLRWSGGGHPPSVLFTPGAPEFTLLKSTGPLMGGLDWDYATREVSVPEGSTLYVYSDGAYELHTADGPWPHAEFLKLLALFHDSGAPLAALVDRLRQIAGHDEFDDDLALIRVRF